MSDIFPFFDGIESEDEQEIPLYKEIAWDYERNCPVIENGEFKIVTENEAIKSWCYRTFLTDRYKYEIHSWNFGTELINLIGKSYSASLINSECIRYIKESLLINPYIKNISNISIDFSGNLLVINCDIDTVYGKFKAEGVKIGV